MPRKVSCPSLPLAERAQVAKGTFTVMQMEELAGRAVEAVEGMLGRPSEQVQLHATTLDDACLENVQSCLQSGWVSTAGPLVMEFESNLSRYTGSNFAIATINGTAALEMCFRVAGVQPGDEIIMPSLSFVATANAARYCGATPHFVDIDPDSLGLDSKSLRERLQSIAIVGKAHTTNRQTGARIAAVCAMHCLGHPCNLPRLQEVCQEFNVALIEDAAEALGSRCAGQHTGTFGVLSAISFNGNKIVTTGGGGALLTNDEDLATRARHLTTTAKRQHGQEFDHTELGWNYRMPAVNAALGIPQLEQLEQTIAAKRTLARAYQNTFEQVPGLELVLEPSDCRSNYWLNCIRITGAEKCDPECLPNVQSARNQILDALNNANFQSRPLWRPMHLLPMYSQCPRGPLQSTEHTYVSSVCLPSSASLQQMLDN